MTSTSVRVWSTREAPPGSGLAYWIDAICEGFLEMDAGSRERATFAGELVSGDLDGLGLNRVTASSQDVHRSPRAIARSRQNFFYLLCKADGPWMARQEQREAMLRPGDLVLVDSRRSYSFHFPERADTASLQLPLAWIAQWLPQAQDHVGQRIDGSTGWGAVLSMFARQLQPELSVAPPLPPRVLADQLGALLSLAVAEGGDATGTRGLCERVVECIDARHAEHGLTAGQVATSCGISPRTLHRSLAAAGTTFHHELVATRMRHAARMLGDPRFDHVTIGEIGYRIGIADASHFARLVRRHLGMAPSRLRHAR